MNPLLTEPWIELRLWRQFVAVADELHFGRAAQRLHMTQPPLSQAVAQLERLLGVRLLERTKRSVALTPAGADVLPHARELLARAQGLPARARAAAAGETGRLQLAFVSTLGFSLLPRWVLEFRRERPQVQLELIEATSDVQLRSLENGDIDAGFVLHAPGVGLTGLQQLKVVSEPLVLALPEAHALAQAARVSLAAALAQPLVLFPRRIAPSLHDAIFGMYHAGARVPVVVQEAIQMQTIVNLVSAGLGLAWVPASVRQFQRSGVVYRQLGGQQAARVPACETSLVWHNASPTLECFTAFVRAQIAAGR